MKKYFGYYVAVGALLFTLAVTGMAKRYGQLLDAFYPYVTRWLQTGLAGVSSRFSLPLWQVLALLLVLALVLTLVPVIRKQKSVCRWLGWVLAVVSLGWLVHTGIYGLNAYAGPLCQDLHLESRTLTPEDYDRARLYFQTQAEESAAQLPRNGQGAPVFEDFDRLAKKAARGFQNLTAEGFSVFSGSALPPKKLLWPALFDALDISGVHVALTGEACVNPDLPPQELPFVMCRQLARRMCILRNGDDDFAAFLACRANEDPQFQYAAWTMACRTLAQPDTEGLAALLVSWYLQENALENQPQNKFDPTDKDYISGILGEEYE